MHPDHTFWPWHGFGMFPFVFFLFFLVIAFVIGRKVGSSSSDNNSPNYDKNNNDQKAIEILKTRLAKGEIDQEEYEKIKKTISE